MNRDELKKCLRCDEDMILLEKTCIQLGESTMLTGSWAAYGGLEVEIYKCNKCLKLEFFSIAEESSDPLKVKCNQCGREYYSYYQSCPKCTMKL